MSKKLLFNLLAVVMLASLVLTACGGTEPTPSGNGLTPKPPTDVPAATEIPATEAPTEEPTNPPTLTQTLTAIPDPEFILPLSNEARAEFQALRDATNCATIDSDTWSGYIDFNTEERTANLVMNICEGHFKISRGNNKYDVVAKIGAYVGEDPKGWLEGVVWSWTLPVAPDGAIFGIESEIKNWLDPDGILMVDGGYEIENPNAVEDAFTYFRTKALPTQTPSPTVTRTPTNTPTMTPTTGATATLWVP